MSDIVELLRTPTGALPPSKWELAAADEIERLRGQIAKVTEAQNWLDERSRNSKSFGHHAFAYEVAARKLREAVR